MCPCTTCARSPIQCAKINGQCVSDNFQQYKYNIINFLFIYMQRQPPKKKNCALTHIKKVFARLQHTVEVSNSIREKCGGCRFTLGELVHFDSISVQ